MADNSSDCWRCIKQRKEIIAAILAIYPFTLYLISGEFRAIIGKYFLNNIFLGSIVIFLFVWMILYLFIRRTEGPFNQKDFSLIVALIALIISMISLINSIG